MKTQKFDHVLIDGKYPVAILQDGVSRSLVSERRSDKRAGWQQEWYDNDRLTVKARRHERATRTEGEAGISLY